MKEAELDNLMDEAREAVKNSYSPYSEFAVGAAVLTNFGEVYAAANVENASYSLSICAERIAICKAVTEGDCEIVALAVYHDGAMLAMPCGACLQVLSEFADANAKIFISNDDITKEMTLGELLPNAFKL